jgi:hypothetical protein
MNFASRTTRSERAKTQLAVIRKLMTAAAMRGWWLTLGEIAQDTQFGEASISAQLRHLRKRKFGNCRVEKRIRRLVPKRRWPARKADSGVVWEYRVSRPKLRRSASRARRARVHAAARQRG